jgi:3-oxoacyl-[acyl-carrier protein] reductase
MDMGLKGKNALVAGASKGLGLAVARGLAAEGCNLALCARSESTLAPAAAGLKDQYGVEVFHQALDLTQKGAAQGFASAALEQMGRVDIVVTNAGGPPAGGFMDFSEEDWRRTVELTLLPAQALVRALLPGMRAQGWGRIVNMTSISVKQPLPGLLLSNSIRAAVVGWAKSLADEVAKDGVTVNNVSPGWMLTERVQELLRHRAQAQGITEQQAREGIVSGIPMGRMGRPQEFADLVVFLASERAGYISGATYWIDGGLYRGMM